MSAAAYYCPSCGGPQASSGPGGCDFCGSARVPLDQPDPRAASPCLACARLVASHHRFCPGCGAAQGPVVQPIHASELACPDCDVNMSIWTLGGGPAQVHGCQHCGAAWIDTPTFAALLEALRTSPAELELRSPVPRRAMNLVEVVYRRCPVCRLHMQRSHFGPSLGGLHSGIVVDECPSCGTYFDATELEGVIAFVRGGGLTRSADADAIERGLLERALTRTPVTEHVPLGPPAVWDGQVDNVLLAFLRVAWEMLRSSAARLKPDRG